MLWLKFQQVDRVKVFQSEVLPAACYIHKHTSIIFLLNASQLVQGITSRSAMHFAVAVAFRWACQLKGAPSFLFPVSPCLSAFLSLSLLLRLSLSFFPCLSWHWVVIAEHAKFCAILCRFNSFLALPGAQVAQVAFLVSYLSHISLLAWHFICAALRFKISGRSVAGSKHSRNCTRSR